MKRIFDLSCVVLTAPLWIPVVLVAALVVRTRLGLPVFFIQERAGRHGRAFHLIKLRTMVNARDAEGRLRPDRERLTPLGRALRATSLDELPELINVLKGEMSLVGPRPLLVEYLPLYSPEQQRRHEVRPGLTGWAQVNGRNAITWEEKFALDVWYVDHRSLGLDLWILMRTVVALLWPRGVSSHGEVGAPKFTGQSTS